VDENTVLAAVKLYSDELVVPAHERIWDRQSSQGFKAFSTIGKSESGETAAFRIGESDALTSELGV